VDIDNDDVRLNGRLFQVLAAASFSTVPTHMMNIYATFHRNPLAK